MEKKSNEVTAWTIAGGILLALTIWRALEVWQYNQAVSQANAEIEKTFGGLAREQAAENRPNAQLQQERLNGEQADRNAQLQVEQHNAEAEQLQPGERCIGRQRFRRVSNGWEQIGGC